MCLGGGGAACNAEIAQVRMSGVGGGGGLWMCACREYEVESPYGSLQGPGARAGLERMVTVFMSTAFERH